MKKFILSLLLVLAALPVGIWLAFPTLVQALETHLARELGLDGLRIVADRPGWRSLRIQQVHATAGSLRLSARHTEVTYRWRELLQGRVQSLDIEALRLEAEAAQVDPAGEPFAVPRLPFALSALPLERARIARIDLAAPHLALQGVGSLEFAQARLVVSATAHTPLAAAPLTFELALQTPAEGEEVQLDLAFFEAGSDPWVTVRASERAGLVEISAHYRLEGFALDRISSLAGLPPGEGLLAGSLAGRLPLDAARQPDWSKLQAEGPATLHWRSIDGSLLIDRFTADARYDGGELNAWIGAAVTATLPDVQLRLQVPDRLQLSANRQRVVLAPGILIDARGGELAVHALLQRLELALDDAPAASLTAEVRLLSPRTLEGVLQADVRALDPLPRHRADIVFNGTLRVNEQPLPLGLSGTYRLEGEELSAELALSSGPIQRLPLQLSYPLDGSAARLRASHRFSWNGPLIAALLPAWEADYDLDRGELDVNLDLALGEALTGTATLRMSAATLRFADYIGQDSTAQLAMDLRPDGMSLRETSLRIGSLDVGFPLTGIEAAFSGDLERLRVSHIQARLLGGQALAAPFDYAVASATADLSVTLTDLDLGAVLALEGKDFSGSGRLDGQLPVRIRGGEISVQGGRIEARAPGGALYLAPSLANAIAQPGLDLALRALQDFRYTTLSAGVDYAESGDLNLSLRLEGHNPDIEKGRPIHYNLNISENIPTLLESLRLSDSFTDSIQKRVIR